MIFIAALFVKAKYWKWGKCPLISVLISYDVSFTTKRCRAVKRNEVDLYTITWKDVQDVLLIENTESCRTACSHLKN